MSRGKTLRKLQIYMGAYFALFKQENENFIGVNFLIF